MLVLIHPPYLLVLLQMHPDPVELAEVEQELTQEVLAHPHQVLLV